MSSRGLKRRADTPALSREADDRPRTPPTSPDPISADTETFIESIRQQATIDFDALFEPEVPATQPRGALSVEQRRELRRQQAAVQGRENERVAGLGLSANLDNAVTPEQRRVLRSELGKEFVNRRVQEATTPTWDTRNRFPQQLNPTTSLPNERAFEAEREGAAEIAQVSLDTYAEIKRYISPAAADDYARQAAQVMVEEFGDTAYHLERGDFAITNPPADYSDRIARVNQALADFTAESPGLVRGKRARVTGGSVTDGRGENVTRARNELRVNRGEASVNGRRASKTSLPGNFSFTTKNGLPAYARLDPKGKLVFDRESPAQSEARQRYAKSDTPAGDSDARTRPDPNDNVRSTTTREESNEEQDPQQARGPRQVPDGRDENGRLTEVNAASGSQRPRQQARGDNPRQESEAPEATGSDAQGLKRKRTTPSTDDGVVLSPLVTADRNAELAQRLAQQHKERQRIAAADEVRQSDFKDRPARVSDGATRAAIEQTLKRACRFS